MGWRRYSEAVLQMTPVSFTGKNFKATSNARNEAMFKEATEFAQSIKILERDMKSLLKNIDVHFKNLRCILVSPLPRIYDEGPNGVQPLDEEPRLLGANMEVEGIPRAAEEARRRIQQEVLDPLHEWMNIYRQIMERMKVLEALRLELDSRRRTVGNLQGKLERVRSTLGTTRHKGEAELRETQDIMIRKQEKMDGTGQKYMDTERTVYNSLYTLVRDTAVLRDYTHCCLNIMQEAFLAAAKAYDTMPTTQLSTNKAVSFAQPESKYEAQLPTAERATPKGIGGLFDRLRGRSKVPQSPASARDAQDIHQDQAMRYGGGYGAMYSNTNDRFSQYNGTQPSSMRPTHESEAPAPYIQQNTGPQQMSGGYPAAANAYMPATTMPYQHQNTGGNYQPQSAGNYQLPSSKYAAGQQGNYVAQQAPAQRVYSDQPTAPVHRVMQDAGSQRYPQNSGQSMPVMAGGNQDWGQNGY